MSTEFTPKFFTTLKNYSKEQLYKDICAGTVVAVIELAISSGITHEKDLITATITGFII